MTTKQRYRYAIIRDGRLYDSSEYRSIAIGLARHWQEKWGGVWSVRDRNAGDREEFVVRPLHKGK